MKLAFFKNAFASSVTVAALAGCVVEPSSKWIAVVPTKVSSRQAVDPIPLDARCIVVTPIEGSFRQSPEDSWISINMSLTGPESATKRFAEILRGQICFHAEKWLKVTGPDGKTVEFRNESSGSRVHFAPVGQDAIRLDLQRVHFTLPVSTYLRDYPPNGRYLIQFKADADWQSLLPTQDTVTSVDMDSREFEVCLGRAS